MCLDIAQQLQVLVPVVPENRFVIKANLNQSRQLSEYCQISATAVQTWLSQYEKSLATFRSYRFECGKSLSELKAGDFAEYYKFLQAPPKR